MIGEDEPDGPVTAARLERCLDRLAFIMSRRSNGGAEFLPLYRRIERDIEEQRAIDAALDQARDRARRSRDRTATRSASTLPAAS